MFSFLYNFFYFFISFIIGLFFLTLGVIAIVLPWSPSFRTEMISFILENSIAISLFGYGFFIIGVAIILNVYLNSRKHYYYLHTPSSDVVVDERVISQHVDSYFKGLFPGKQVHTRVFITRNKVKVLAELPPTPKPEQERLKIKIPEDMNEILTQLLGRPPVCSVSLTFPPTTE